MKKLHCIGVVIVLCFLTFSASAQKSENIIIKGKILNAAGETLYLTEFSKDIPFVDSVVINSDHSYTFDFEYDKTNFFKMALSPDEYVTLVVGPGDKLSFDADKADNFSNPEVDGSKETEFIYEILKEFQNYSAIQDSLIQAFQNHENPEDSIAIINEYNELMLDIEAYLNQQIIEHKNLLSVLLFIDKLDVDKYSDTYKKIVASLEKRHSDNPFVVDFVGTFKKEEMLAIGAVAPDINLPGPGEDGESVSLYSLRGKIVLLDFWASWCSPCIRELPNLINVYNKYNDQGFEIYGVSLDKSHDAWKGAIEKYDMNWVHVSDLKYWQSKAAQLYNVEGIPYTVLIDKEGKIIAKGLRGNALEEKLKEIFE